MVRAPHGALTEHRSFDARVGRAGLTPEELVPARAGLGRDRSDRLAATGPDCLVDRVAAAAGGFRLGAHRLGFRQRPLVVALSLVPFLVFAFGIAIGAGWSTWH